MSHVRMSPPPARSDWGHKAAQRTWKTLGSVCFAIGIINAFIPLLPTTVFLLIGVWAYGKGDPALRERLLQHPRFGASLRLWVEKRQISRKGKIGAVGGICLSAAFTATAIGPKPIMWVIVGGLLGLSAWLAMRDEPVVAAASTASPCEG
jgi:uncharacterized membrane protein YbaN (DUF454 family)